MSTTTTDKPRPEIAIDGFPKRQSGFGRMITSADHKDIAKILMVGSGGFLFIAALEFFLMRLQLAIPENTFMEPVMFNRILSLYGATSIFFFALPLVMGLFLYVAPLQVGARGTALPRLSQMGGLLWAAGAVVLGLADDRRRMCIDDNLPEGVVRTDRVLGVGGNVLEKLEHGGNALRMDTVLGFLQA